jgi:excisionase family DNA binding protein
MAGREDPLLDVNTAAEYLGVTQRFIRRLVAERRIPYHKLGRFVRIAQSDLDALLATNRRDAILR